MDSTENLKDLHARRKILSVSDNEVLQSIYSLHDIENIILHKELPEGYIIKGVWYDHASGSFDFIIIHPSFDIVLEGAVPPHVDDLNLIVKQYNVKAVKHQEDMSK